jgi:threonine synthase
MRRRWRCDCGGLLGLDTPPADPLTPTSHAGPWSLWRYRTSLPPDDLIGAWPSVTLGEGLTPLVRAPHEPELWWKLDYVMPTGSFKDRGAVLLASAAATLGMSSVVVDSSGNAGAAMATYAARAGIGADIFVPTATPSAKVAAMRAQGATVYEVAGDRAAVAAAATERVATTKAFYASHVYQPLFAHGVKTLAFELYEQLGRRAPATVVVPAGNGTLVLGLKLGFDQLAQAGRVERIPVIVAVQAERCAPLAGLPPATSATMAAGIAIASPPRQTEVRQAIEASGGTVLTVTEDEIQAAQQDLARHGLWVEPTAAVGWGAARGNQHSGPIVVVLTGRGLTVS